MAGSVVGWSTTNQVACAGCGEMVQLNDRLYGPSVAVAMDRYRLGRRLLTSQHSSRPVDGPRGTAGGGGESHLKYTTTS